MKSIKYIVGAMIAAGLTVSSYATVTVTWQTGAQTYITDSGGAPNDASQLANNDLLEIGTWASMPASITAGNLNAELSSFEVFATGSINEGAGTFGIISGATAGATFTGKQIVMIAYNSPTAQAIVNGSTQVAIFYANDSLMGSWKMPADSPTASTLIDPGDLFVGGGSGGAALNAGGTVLWGAADTDVANNYSLIDTKGIVVPEPSSLVLVVMGLLGGIGLIRRRR